ncbi:peroxiredoxin family protein [Patescibacteria group bacterium AH-259-L05]|nr:peroxiredoxin family protein [Patescibacteria group bacterium AH-259-L05]
MKKLFTILGVCCIAFVIMIGLIILSRPESGQLVGTRVGSRAPDFTIQTIEGQIISLADFKLKKVLVITSTASWCPTCIIEAHEFAPVYPEVRDEVEFLSVSIDPTDTETKLKIFQASTNTPWLYTTPNLSGVREMIINYKLTRFEITYIIDTDGIIQFKDSQITSSTKLKQELDKFI